MSFPEQADSSAERTTKPDIYSRIEGERVIAGSTLAYVKQLGERYQGNLDHKPNLMQLQRIAGMATNPTGESSFPGVLTNAFYWGQILAYRAQDLLSEGEWAELAYPMFSSIVREHLETAQLQSEEPEYDAEKDEWIVPTRSQAERLRELGDMIMYDLEVIGHQNTESEDDTPDEYADDDAEQGVSEFMPPVMEKLIIAMTDELTDFPEERWYMILGFRHLTTQVVQLAVNAKMKQDASQANEDKALEEAAIAKKEERDSALLMKQFIKLMDKNEIDDVQGREVIGIDDVRDKIMESYADHMIAYGVYDAGDEEDVDTLSMYLTHKMNRDFLALEDLSADDFLEIDGNAIYILYREDSDVRNMHMLGHGETLKGSTESVAVVETPSAQTMMRLQERLIDPDEISDETNPLGVVMILSDPVLVNADGEHMQLGEGVVAGVVMSNPDMRIAKYIL